MSLMLEIHHIYHCSNQTIRRRDGSVSGLSNKGYVIQTLSTVTPGGIQWVREIISESFLTCQVKRTILWKWHFVKSLNSVKIIITIKNSKCKAWGESELFLSLWHSYRHTECQSNSKHTSCRDLIKI